MNGWARIIKKKTRDLEIEVLLRLDQNLQTQSTAKGFRRIRRIYGEAQSLAS
jgi:hypothetical protein